MKTMLRNLLKRIFFIPRSKKELWSLVRDRYKKEPEALYLCVFLSTLYFEETISRKEMELLQETLSNTLRGHHVLETALGCSYLLGSFHSPRRKFRIQWMDQQIERCEWKYHD